MADVRVMQRFEYHGEDAGTLVEAMAQKDCAWLSINSFVHPNHQEDAPQINLYFERGLQGRQQILALIASLEDAAAVLLADREQADVAALSQ